MIVQGNKVTDVEQMFNQVNQAVVDKSMWVYKGGKKVPKVIDVMLNLKFK